MKIILLIVLTLAGQQPIQDAKEMPSMKVCEAAAHKYNTAKLPDNTSLAYAACVRVNPDLGKPA